MSEYGFELYLRNLKEEMRRKHEFLVSTIVDHSKFIIKMDNVEQCVFKDRIFPTAWTSLEDDCAQDLIEINKYLRNRRSEKAVVYPADENIFRALQLTEPSKVKVVIIGQDPYYSEYKGQPLATGLAFGVFKGMPIPPSLKNIYKELENCYTMDSDISYKFVTPDHGCLDQWGKAGVLLLNMSLTVEKGQAGSHIKLWLGIVYEILKLVMDSSASPVFLLLGKEAKKIIKIVGNRIDYVESGHPSPLSAKFFLGTKCFLQVDNKLKSKGIEPVDWRIN